MKKIITLAATVLLSFAAQASEPVRTERLLAASEAPYQGGHTHVHGRRVGLRFRSDSLPAARSLQWLVDPPGRYDNGDAVGGYLARTSDRRGLAGGENVHG